MAANLSNLPATLPHWLLEILGIALGLALVVPTWYGASEPATVISGGYVLIGGGVTGLIHDMQG